MAAQLFSSLVIKLFYSSLGSDGFKGCREFAVSPLLIYTASGKQYARRRKELGISPLTETETSMVSQMAPTELRWNKLLDSGLSGLLTGGVLRGLRSKSLISYVLFSASYGMHMQRELVRFFLVPCSSERLLRFSSMATMN